jgi:hypothetical protein
MAETQQQSQQIQKREVLPVKVSDTGILRPANMAEAIEVAKLIAHSGMVPKSYEGNTGAVLVAIQMGSELGLSPMGSLQSIAVINGRPSIYGDAMLALVVSRRDCEDVIESFDEKTMTATCMVKRSGRSPIERTFSMADAKTAGLMGKQGPWSQYPKRMLQQRARGFALRDSFPDALRGIVSTEEAGDYVHTSVDPLVSSSTPETAPQSKTAQLLAKRNQRVVAEAREPEIVSVVSEATEEPLHNPTTGEVLKQQSEALVSVLSGIANADNSQELTSVIGALKKLVNGEKETATNEYRAKQRMLDAKAKDEAEKAATKGETKAVTRAREPGVDG